MDEYSTSLELRIDWSEIDAFGHINNLAIMKYIQTARVNYLEGIGMMPLQRETGLGPVLASTSCQFKKQLHYPGNVVIISLVDQINITSFHMKHSVIDNKKELIAECHDVIVMFNFCKNIKHPIPEIYRKSIKDHESHRHKYSNPLLPTLSD